MKVSFLTPLDVERRRQSWVVKMPFAVRIEHRGKVTLVDVPVGFKTDFASVPRLPLVYTLVGDTAHKAAVLHDYLYWAQVDRAFADDAFAAAMRTEGVPGWRRWLMWAGVRLFGWNAYRGHAS